ncbi:hypothetical protein QN277_005735 [Acacia crassicarpa]|uniref:F-box domain-containing protein n=1 Tax=Acacia crassicarpa TaxID=499986 RepID=A0AAE1IYT8_9FABA|nr:hypothetical protein QN277_005735 [Acacia crassicarpa]
MADGIPILPDDMIQNILERLPVKSLMRFQCVCRQWRILFKTQYFITNHLHHSNHQNPCLLLQRYGIDNPSNFYCLDSEMQVSELQKPPLLNSLKRGEIIGSSNGLLCVEINKHDPYYHLLLVWNPAIREVRRVPETKFHEDYRNYLIGFGFCPITNDYKIVITYSSGLYADLSAVKVYSLSTGAWREVELRLNDTVRLNSRSVTVNGVMFWLVLKRFEEYTENRIVSFDLEAEEFTVITIPELQPIKLTVYEEKLVIFSENKNSEHSAIDMWVMEEGVGASGERWGWTKKYTSSPNPCLLNPTCFLNLTTIWRNEIVFCPPGEEESTVLLNPTTGEMKKFAISKCDYGYCRSNYAESLVRVEE